MTGAFLSLYLEYILKTRICMGGKMAKTSAQALDFDFRSNAEMSLPLLHLLGNGKKVGTWASPSRLDSFISLIKLLSVPLKNQTLSISIPGDPLTSPPSSVLQMEDHLWKDYSIIGLLQGFQGQNTG